MKNHLRIKVIRVDRELKFLSCGHWLFGGTIQSTAKGGKKLWSDTSLSWRNFSVDLYTQMTHWICPVKDLTQKREGKIQLELHWASLRAAKRGCRGAAAWPPWGCGLQGQEGNHQPGWNWKLGQNWGLLPLQRGIWPKFLWAGRFVLGPLMITGGISLLHQLMQHHCTAILPLCNEIGVPRKWS